MTDLLTARAACELAEKEGLVLETYLDNATPPRWTWGIGVTDASGHRVARYKNNPSTVEHALEIYAWLLRTKYVPDVLKAFGKFALTEAQFAAALSFHYNTGAILRTDWVKLVLQGQMKQARDFLTEHYLNGGNLQSRRDEEAALFFDGKWKNDGHVNILPVLKPSYQPSFRRAVRTDILADMVKALAA